MRSKVDFVLPDNVAGVLDWSTGMLFINETQKDWDLFRRMTHVTPRLGSPFAQLAQTITHEQYHFLQIITTGYLYRFVSLLYQEVLQIVEPLIKNIELHQLPTEVPEPSSAIRTLVADLDAMGHRFLTTREIIESAAYLYEFKTHVRNLKAEDYSQFLKKSPQPPPLYQYAYKLAAERLGDATFSYFLPLASLSLCFDKPNQAFFDLVECFSTSRIAYHDASDLKKLREAARTISTRHVALGTSEEIINSAALISHPVYYPAVKSINSNRSGGWNLDESATQKSLLELVMDPFHLNSADASQIVQPFVFKDRSIYIPAAFGEKSKLKPDALHGRLFDNWVYASIAFTITSKANLLRLREVA